MSSSGPAVTRIVLIDDTPDFRLLLRLALEQYPEYSIVAEAPDGARGIEVVQQWQPDVVLLDLAMPVLDGLQALPRIRAVCPDARVVVFSGFEGARMGKSAVEAGASSYLQKGASPEEVIAAIAAAMGEQVPPVRVLSGKAESDDADSELELLKAALATAAHELRSPSTILLGLTQALRTRVAKPAGAGRHPAAIGELLDAIVRQAQVLDRVTADLLLSAQAERSALPVDLQQMRLLPALRTLTENLDTDGTGKNVEIEVNCPSDVSVVADRVRVQQMLTNLLSNAVKYGRPPYRLVASRRGDYVELRLTDRGPGIADAFVPQLFDRYTRAPGLRVNGTGIGLSVVKALAAAQGGKAWYEPHPDGGSQFCFSLPVPVAADGARDEKSDAA